MNTQAGSYRLVSGLAVAAVTVAALGAAAGTLLARSMGEAPDVAVSQSLQRPAADAEIRVVKAPPEDLVRQQPAAYKECGGKRDLEASL